MSVTNITDHLFPVAVTMEMNRNTSLLQDLTNSVTSEYVNNISISTSTTEPSGSLKEASSQCIDWRETQHVLFQMGSLALVVGFFMPYTMTNHTLYSRIGYVMGCLLLVLWSVSVVCHQDVLAWYIILCLVNLAHIVFWIYQKWPASFPSELEDTYIKVFKPLKVSQAQFKELAAICHIEDLPNGASYAMEGATPIGKKVSILVPVRLKVTCDNFFMHTIEPCYFVDSIKYDTMASIHTDNTSNETFQVTIKALEDSKLAVWETEYLGQLLQTSSSLSAVMTNLLGKDITHKLYQVQEMLLTHPQYVRILANRNSVSHLRHSIHQKDLSSSSTTSLNGMQHHTSISTPPPHSISILCHPSSSSPPDCTSSSGSRNPVFQSQNFLTPNLIIRSPSQLSLETCV